MSGVGVVSLMEGRGGSVWIDIATQRRCLCERKLLSVFEETLQVNSMYRYPFETFTVDHSLQCEEKMYYKFSDI